MSTAQLAPLNNPQYLDANGKPVAGGSLYSYIAGTSTPQATYTDETAGTPNANPLVLDSNGCGIAWIRTDQSYKFILKDSSSNVIRTWDNVNAVNPGSIDKTKIASNVAGVALLQNGGGQLDVQVDNVSIGVNGSNQLILKTGSITPDFLPASSKLEVIFKNVRDFNSPGICQTIPQYEWTTPSQLAGPPTPPGQCFGLEWCPNGEFLAVACGTTPFVLIYQISQGAFTKLANPGTIPPVSTSWVEWSPCGDFLVANCAANGNSGDFIEVYQRTGNSFSALGSLPSSWGTMSTGGTTASKFSPNSDFLLIRYFGKTVSSVSTSGIAMWERSGTTFTDITSTSTLSNINPPFAWSPDSSMLAAIDGTTANVDVFSRADKVFTGITAPVMSTYSGDVQDMAFSPDGNFLALALSVTPYVLIFSVTGQTFSSALSNPATLPAGAANGIKWSANSEYLLVGHASSPFMTIYQVTNPTTSPTFTKIANPSNLPGAAVQFADWTQTKQFLAVSIGNQSPYVQVYKTSSTLPGDSLMWSRGVPNV